MNTRQSLLTSLMAFAFIMPTPPPMPTVPPMPTFLDMCKYSPIFCASTSAPTPPPVPTIPPIPTPRATITPTASPTSSPTASPSNLPTPSQSILAYGAYVGDGVDNLNAVNQFEAMTNKQLDVILVYQAWVGGWRNFQPQWVSNAESNGSKLMITWEPWNYTSGVNQPTYRLSQIANGTHDAFIAQYARDAKATGKEFYLRPMHEMNGNWYPWAESVNGNKPGDYIKAWRHMVDVFRAQGATNVKFVWCPNVNYTGSTPLTQLFPGDDYVDYVCLDGYNWGNTNGGWQTFNQVFRSSYEQLLTLSAKPVIIGETASAEQGGNKGTWITDAYATVKGWNKVVVVNWFNANKEKDWRVYSTQNSLHSYKESIK